MPSWTLILGSFLFAQPGEAAEYEWKWSEEEDAKALQQCIDGGMVIGTVSDEDKWAEKARSVWPKFYDTVGGKQFVDQALEAMK